MNTELNFHRWIVQQVNEEVALLRIKIDKLTIVAEHHEQEIEKLQANQTAGGHNSQSPPPPDSNHKPNVIHVREAVTDEPF